MKKIHDDDIKKAFHSLYIPPAKAEKVEKAAKESVRFFAAFKKNKKDETKSKGFQETNRLMGKIKQLFINSEGEPIMTRTQFAGISVAAIAVILTLTIQSNNLKPTVVKNAEVRRIKAPETSPPETVMREGKISTKAETAMKDKVRSYEHAAA